MSISRRLQAHRASTPAPEAKTTENTQNAVPVDDDYVDADSAEKKEEQSMSNEEHIAAVEQARAEGFSAANARAAAVMTCEHYAGNEKLAAKMLGKDALSAEDIIDMLSDASRVEHQANDVDDSEAAAREEMKAAIQSGKGPEIEANPASENPGPKASVDVWGKTYSKLGIAADA